MLEAEFRLQQERAAFETRVRNLELTLQEEEADEEEEGAYGQEDEEKDEPKVQYYESDGGDDAEGNPANKEQSKII